MASFRMNLFLVVILAAGIQIEAQYVPCQSWISFSYDDSMTLTTAQFKTQMTFIKNVIGTLNHPERLRVEGAYTGEFNWNSILTIPQMQNAIDGAASTQNPYSLSQQAASLLTSVEVLDSPLSVPVGALIFLSDTSDSALKNADRWFSKLSGIQITFVLLGSGVDSTKLRKFSSSFIYWQDLTQTQPDNWDQLSFGAFGCGGGAHHTTTPSPNLPTTSATYVPCKSWISFIFDDSSSLRMNDFKTQMTFISSVLGSINHPERVKACGAYYEVAPWKSPQTIAQMQTEIAAIHQSLGGFSLLNQLSNLMNDVELIINKTMPIGALIFISDTSLSALRGAESLIPYLKKAQMTFVLMGPNVDQSQLTKFSSSFIQWRDLSKPQPDNWDSVFANAYGCNSF